MAQNFQICYLNRMIWALARQNILVETYRKKNQNSMWLFALVNVYSFYSASEIRHKQSSHLPKYGKSKFIWSNALLHLLYVKF